MKEKIEKWYKLNLWTFDMVKNAVEKGIITKEQYTEITGKQYI